ncbi:hypothetical protein A3J20_03340 [Candidatus Gottesmanbacteria bacterium RIFCSPLOWO2_02_FULL_42_29]|uniref:Peptidase C39-like domain-containing protein n=2 Tax=Candidatus Gottesmaniibacteriota TaxID=1752720 RepID=A0A1F6BDN2_9BACT|nr:MAG: hypothetical protein UV09_C0002G0034 [Candidatus Gottesmanbacteria bacterium GW2011_GWA2_42_18]KKS75649.1 MAG: hypothetical protein UV46_C0015G0025 [Candidatus Gottesmanbacteria bacterium GW2011_GWC2_42_8]OGG12210.1 MAG: hypothetical protein A2781_04825 [Candidatus Gottesmanbacteria bacterium RIFCSPHIGHO2_01_FULL_42_27]OGG21698.1 MAG: hypothetical protein A3E72_04490 [Candidatus Gottesmanbacteria bacterium RIFCSPHIGHO2_12_FULL_43_26]OGG34237.1 MAG: hypothetical protein A3G68_02955 [Cand
MPVSASSFAEAKSKRFWPVIVLVLILFAPTAFGVNAVVSAQTATPVKSIKFGSFTPPPTNTKTPLPSPTAYVSIPPLSTTPEPDPKKIYFFSQRDPRWRTYNPYTVGQLGPCGCGETSTAMILTSVLDNSSNPDQGYYNPPRMWDYYENLYPGRCGTGIEWHKNTLESFAFRASINAYDRNNPQGSNNVIKNYLNNGYLVIIYYKRPATYGHYVVLSDIIGSTIKVYDPYYLPGASMPVTIESIAIIQSFVAAKK